MMLKAHSFATPDTPSTPEQNLQYISLYDDFLFFENNKNGAASLIQPGHLSGWIKPQKNQFQGDISQSFKSKELNKNICHTSRKIASQCMARHRQTRSLCIGLKDRSEQSRPNTTQFHIKRTFSHRLQLDGKARDPIHNSGISLQLKKNPSKSNHLIVERKEQDKEKNIPKSARNIVPFPFFDQYESPERSQLVQVTAVGKIRTLMKNKNMRIKK